MRGRIIAGAIIAMTAGHIDAQPIKTDNPQIDFAGFAALTSDVQQWRYTRLLDLGSFQAMAEQPGTLLLDARSAASFAAGHIEGAVNLPLPVSRR